MKLKNTIDSGTVTGFGPITVDDLSYPVDKITLKIREKELRADQISYQEPVPVYILAEIEIKVSGEPLAAGEHRIGFLINTLEAGRIQFSISEPVV